MIGRAWKWVLGLVAGLLLVAAGAFSYRRRNEQKTLDKARENDADSRAKTAGDLAKLGELKAREEKLAAETSPRGRKQAEVDAELRRRGKIL